MIHPLVFGVLLVDGIAALLLISAALKGEAVVRRWAPGAATEEQLTLERSAEMSSLLGRSGLGFVILGSLALLLGITAVLPGLVPGAMCGTGVMTAMEGRGEHAIALRGLALGLLGAWALVDRLNRAAPMSPLAPMAALAMLLAAPMTLWSQIETARALVGLDVHEAVDCCAALYAAAMPTGAKLGPAVADDTQVMLFFVAAAGLAVGGGVRYLSRRAADGIRLGLSSGLAAVALVWAPLAFDVLIRRFAAYHYEVLAHHCPWCLFLPEHGAVGYGLFGALAAVVFGGLFTLLATFLGSRTPEVAQAAERAARRSAGLLAIGAVVFTALATGPAALWFWRFGVWLR